MTKMLEWYTRPRNATPVSEDGAAGERYRLTATLLEKATELITTIDHDSLLEGLCRSLVEATPHILLAWSGSARSIAQKLSRRLPWDPHGNTRKPSKSAATC